MRRRKLPNYASTYASADPVAHAREPRAVRFDSLSALADYALTALPLGLESVTNAPTREWTLGVDLPKACDMAKHGWPEGTAQAKRLLESIPELTPRESYSSATYHDVQGSYVDIGEYVQGTPECMVDFREDKRTARFVRIRVAGFVSCGYDSETIMRRGVCIAAIIDALEARGVRCEVDLITNTSDSPWETHVNLKRFSDPLNLDVLVFAVAHPASFRRLNFAVQELEPEAVQRSYRLARYGSYLHPKPIDEEPDALAFQTLSWRDQYTPEQAKQVVLDALARFAEKD